MFSGAIAKAAPEPVYGGPLLANRNALLESQIRAAKAQYAPQQAYADAASKIAYANMLPYQIQATIASNPYMWMALKDNPEAQKTLMSNLAKSIPQAGNIFGNVNLQPPEQNNSIAQMFQNSPIGKLFGGLFGNQSSQTTQTPQNALQQNPAQLMQGGAVQGNMDQSFLSSMNSPAQTRNISQAPNDYIQTSPIGGENQNYFYDVKAGTTGSEATGRNIAEQWKERQDEINQQVSGAQEMERQLDRMKDLRKDLSVVEKGFPLGNLPAMSNAGQESDTVANNLVAARLKAWQTQRITNMDIGFGQTMKPGRYMNEEAFNHEVNYEKGMSQRLQELPAFTQRAIKLGLTPAQADAIWARYANEKPFYDPSTHQINKNNLGKWEDYLTKDGINETFSPQFKSQMDQYRSNMAGGNSNEDQKILSNFQRPTKGSTEQEIVQARSILDGKSYKKVNGKWYSE